MNKMILDDTGIRNVKQLFGLFAIVGNKTHQIRIKEYY